MNEFDARELTAKIAEALEVAWDLIITAYRERVWLPLGYETWDAYCTAEFNGQKLKLPREERREVVASMREAGMSVRAIASATGLGKGTVEREAPTVPNGTVRGINGKTYTANHPERREPFPEDNVIDVEFTEEPVEAPDDSTARFAKLNSMAYSIRSTLEKISDLDNGDPELQHDILEEFDSLIKHIETMKVWVNSNVQAS